MVPHPRNWIGNSESGAQEYVLANPPGNSDASWNIRNSESGNHQKPCHRFSDDQRQEACFKKMRSELYMTVDWLIYARSQHNYKFPKLYKISRERKLSLCWCTQAVIFQSRLNGHMWESLLVLKHMITHCQFLEVLFSCYNWWSFPMVIYLPCNSQRNHPHATLIIPAPHSSLKTSELLLAHNIKTKIPNKAEEIPHIVTPTHFPILVSYNIVWVLSLGHIVLLCVSWTPSYFTCHILSTCCVACLEHSSLLIFVYLTPDHSSNLSSVTISTNQPSLNPLTMSHPSFICLKSIIISPSKLSPLMCDLAFNWETILIGIV